MARVSYAVAQLVKQVQALKPDAAFEHGDEDGFGVYRTITFGDATSRWLAPLMDPLDERFARSEMSGGVLTLTVQGRSVLADDKTPFNLPQPEPRLAPLDGDELLGELSDSPSFSGDPDPADEPADPEPEPEAKPAAKKTAPRKRAESKASGKA